MTNATHNASTPRPSNTTGEALGTTEQRIRGWKLCGKRCPVCRAWMVVGGDKRTGLTIDHLVPHVAGGSNDAGNLYPLCAACNSSKNDHALAAWLPAYLIQIGRRSTAADALRLAREITAKIDNLVAGYAAILEG